MLLIVLTIVIFKLVQSAVNTGYSTVRHISGLDIENEIVKYRLPICPDEPGRRIWFNFKCNTDEDCKIFGERCCQYGKKKICRQGVTSYLETTTHKALVPGIPRLCPTKEAIIEFLPVQNCTKDGDCGPRICCPDGRISYCRTAVPKVDTRLAPRLVQNFKTVVSYLQCTSPPPPLLDFFPKPCRNTFDCFPNLCCQEKGKKVCRPPKKSILNFLAALP